MEIAIGVVGLIMAFVMFICPGLPPKDTPETTVRMWKLSALFLIAAAICFK